MFSLIAPLFQRLYDETGLNFIIFYDRYEYDRFVSGIAISLQLIFWSILLSLVIGVLGAWVQTSRSRLLRGVVNGYIQLFRNTPPLIQLLFFYFGLGAFTPQVDMGGYYEPLISSFAWAILSLGIFGGAFNVEIFRSGIEAVPKSTAEAAESLCFSRWQTYAYITLPLAFRISLPALTNNLVSLAKTTSLAYVISVPEMTYTLNQVWSDNINVPEMMLVLFLFYVIIVSLIAAGLHWLEKRLALPGYGR
ncbi:amino acid ABC transporter permease [Afifella marina]|uniref:Polar amino acid transport system permease protein n=1 Tax=Afifella marina DSM 2698 TaxID=1120955 RepID=A0A1G5M8P7_AFIMA|nr:amino acid ABC transporter permease [Afifella marina]MBK1622859.1 amino acid ABC transporter permease [Afifella marina DSM 2698]MBK1625854.1 amino acid ABC transporter permease [Afifella marina]MBK5917676.1 polar amino acid ABC transporter permease [Afifella marina]RAI23599.1 polar amino acid ABC transporter permease [Afifella marina DSM 2698]SCZ21184.1 polar amino acid transport system permease protein [Afifella marina DSM 2698]